MFFIATDKLDQFTGTSEMDVFRFGINPNASNFGTDLDPEGDVINAIGKGDSIWLDGVFLHPNNIFATYDANQNQTTITIDIDQDGTADRSIHLANGDFRGDFDIKSTNSVIAGVELTNTIITFQRGAAPVVFTPNIDFASANLVGMYDYPITGTIGPDIINALGGNTVVSGGGGNDLIDGGPGMDTLFGNDGNDIILGGTGTDTLSGGDGNDLLINVDGISTLNGGPGNNAFLFRVSATADNITFIDQPSSYNTHIILVDRNSESQTAYSFTYVPKMAEVIYLAGIDFKLTATVLTDTVDIQIPGTTSATAGTISIVVPAGQIDTPTTTVALSDGSTTEVERPNERFLSPQAEGTITIANPEHGFRLFHQVQLGSDASDTFELTGSGFYYSTGGGVDSATFSGTSAELSLYVDRKTTHDLFFIDNSIFAFTDVEEVVFSDRTLRLDFDGVAGSAYRIYQAGLGRTPDEGGLGFFVRGIDTGTFTLQSMAAAFIASDEFKDKYGTPDTITNATFIDLLYENVLGREGDPGGRAFHTEFLDTGGSRADAMANFAESQENIFKLLPLMYDGIWIS